MKIHEYQAKQILAKYGVPVPRGSVAYSVDEATQVADDLATKFVLLKLKSMPVDAEKAAESKFQKARLPSRKVLRLFSECSW